MALRTLDRAFGTWYANHKRQRSGHSGIRAQFATEECAVYFGKRFQFDRNLHHIYEANYFMQHKRVHAFIKQENFDVVHIHWQSQSFSYALDAKLAGVKNIIRTVHNVFVFHGLVQAREFITRQLSRFIGVKYVAISKSVYNNEVSRFHIHSLQVNNWYDENRFFFTSEELKTQARLVLGIDPKSYCIVSVGNCTPVKNHMAILKTIVKYAGDSEFFDVIYLHVGHGVQENVEKDFAIKNGIEKRISFCGYSDPVKYLQASDLFVMPSIYEGFGISGIEGLATGIKTIFTDVPGLCDFKGCDFDNLRYCHLDDESLAIEIYDAILEGKSINNLKQAEDIKRWFGIKTGVDKYQKIYFG